MAVRSTVKKFSVNQIPKEFEFMGITFKAVPELDYRTSFLNTSNDDDETRTGVEIVVDHIEEMLFDEDERAQFRTLIDDPDLFIPVSTLVDIQTWLLEEYGIIKRDPKSRN